MSRLGYEHRRRAVAAHDVRPLRRRLMKARTMTIILALMIPAWLTYDDAGARGSPVGGGQAAGRGAAAPSPYPVTQGKASRFEKIAEGVYYGTGSSGGNSPVIVGDREALIIDTKTTPAAARVFL